MNNIILFFATVYLFYFTRTCLICWR